MKEKIEQFKKLQRTLHAKSHLMGVLSFDSETQAPKGSTDGRGETMAMLSEEIFTLQTSPEAFALIDELKNAKDIDPITARQVELMDRELKMLKNMPMQEYIDYQVLLNKSHEVWAEAKVNNDFASFAPYLEKIIQANIRMAGYIDSSKKPYDALLGQYEYGYGMADYDPFFTAMQKNLVPIILEIGKRPAPNTSFLETSYPIEQQKALSQRVMDIMGIDKRYCALSESEHPFTTHFNKHDVRITTHYYENAVDSSLYSVLHEGGHALYELHTGDTLQNSNLATGTSLGMHESQSRFYENIIGRNKAFTNRLLVLMQEIFPTQLQNVSQEEFYRALNKVSPSLIRIEADELTYSLHVLIRYEIEKKLISGELAVADAPAYWNKLYKDYLGVDVPNDSQGILQDVHWALGSIGYFPTYALGSAYGAQMLHAMQKQIDFQACLESGDIAPVSKWLEENIHVHGSMLDPKQILEQCCGEAFNPQYYFDYLSNKFKEIYQL
ncbi:MAG: carboxypeptidase M32 [Eubacteriales bacterium]|nr:carboxypeptidase M32 [Eubacteriales bacterium]